MAAVNLAMQQVYLLHILLGKRVANPNEKTHHQNVDFNVYEGMEVTGNAMVTLSRGTVVWKDGELRTQKGAGKYISRKPFAPYINASNARSALLAATGVDRS